MLKLLFCMGSWKKRSVCDGLMDMNATHTLMFVLLEERQLWTKANIQGVAKYVMISSELLALESLEQTQTGICLMYIETNYILWLIWMLPVGCSLRFFRYNADSIGKRLEIRIASSMTKFLRI